MTFELDREGGAEVLKEMTKAHILELALQVGELADEGATVAEFSTIDEYTTDRAVATVTVPAERQAKDGVLTRAAAAAGLEVNPPK
ncbi:hypothetical protein [Mycobacterium sp. D16R24]|uniref:hypothetical protein n=1 Tax=Mycobacterium sp. D16R24 TaxID=1855656 RepID=UPI0011171867|nr:hypothetical protein [Mycobacterium sp. D16R24]